MYHLVPTIIGFVVGIIVQFVGMSIFDHPAMSLIRFYGYLVVGGASGAIIGYFISWRSQRLAIQTVGLDVTVAFYFIILYPTVITPLVSLFPDRTEKTLWLIFTPIAIASCVIFYALYQYRIQSNRQSNIPTATAISIIQMRELAAVYLQENPQSHNKSDSAKT